MKKHVNRPAKQTLKREYRDAIRNNPALMGIIAQIQGKSYKTIERQLTVNHPYLATEVVQREIRKFLKLSQEIEMTDLVPMSDTTTDL